MLPDLIFIIWNFDQATKFQMPHTHTHTDTRTRTQVVLFNSICIFLFSFDWWKCLIDFMQIIFSLPELTNTRKPLQNNNNKMCSALTTTATLCPSVCPSVCMSECVCGHRNRPKLATNKLFYFPLEMQMLCKQRKLPNGISHMSDICIKPSKQTSLP